MQRLQERFPAINWSAIAVDAFQRHIRRIEKGGFDDDYLNA
jgi:hypothetical protein